MNKPGIFVIPILVIGIVMLVMNRLMASGAVTPTTLIVIAAAAFLLTLLIRPKKTAGKAAPDSSLALLGDYSKEAFAHNEALSKQFHSAVSDYIQGMPKAATGKLEKLQDLCASDVDVYAVSVALGMVKTTVGDFEGAIQLYNKAVVIHPTAELADAIGSAYQRIGKLEKAMDSYEFALDLDPNAIDIRAKLATAHVGDGQFEAAIDQAQQVLDLQPDNASALATIAICHGVMDHTSLYEGYTAKAVEAGYSEQKITTTVPALKKKFKKTLESLK